MVVFRGTDVALRGQGQPLTKSGFEFQMMRSRVHAAYPYCSWPGRIQVRQFLQFSVRLVLKSSTRAGAVRRVGTGHTAVIFTEDGPFHGYFIAKSIASCIST